MEVAVLSKPETNVDDSISVSEQENINDQEEKQDEEKLTDKKFSYFEPMKGIIFAVVATIIFLGFPQVITYVFVGRRMIPTFDAVVVRSLWIPIILWMIFRIAIEVAYIIERNYTKKLAIVTIIGNVLAIICGLIIFIRPRIVYGEYVDFIHRYFEDMAEWFSVPLTRVLDSPNIIILVFMIFFLVLECITTIRKSRRPKDDEDEEDKDNVETADTENNADAGQVNQ